MSTATDVSGHRIPALENDRMRQAAEILLRARREMTPIADLPAKLRPHTLDEAYALQDIDQVGVDVNAMEPAGHDEALHDTHVFGAQFSPTEIPIFPAHWDCA